MLNNWWLLNSTYIRYKSQRFSHFYVYASDYIDNIGTYISGRKQVDRGTYSDRKPEMSGPRTILTL